MPLIQTILPLAGKRLVTIQYDSPLVEAARLLSEMSANLVVVCSHEGSMLGVVTKSDVVQQISHCQGCSCTTMVADVMTKDVTACHPDHSLYDVWLIMKGKGLKQVPITDQASAPLGLLYASDALEALIKEAKYEQLLMRDYVMGVGYH